MTGKDISALFERVAQNRELDPGVARLILRKILDIMDAGEDPSPAAGAKKKERIIHEML